MELFTNTNERGDFLKHALLENARDTQIYIAVAFFSDSQFIEQAIENGCEIKLIVRLGEGTNIARLGQIIGNEQVKVRYYTSTNFHPKIYIFKNKVAFIGSSNLTQSGLTSNQEINVSIENDNPIFNSLYNIFLDYWRTAKVLTSDIIERIEELEIPRRNEAETNYWQSVQTITGVCNFANIDRIGERHDNDIEDFIAEFLRDYQIFLNKYSLLKNAYQTINSRKCSSVPLKIEIDQFLNWIRVTEAGGNRYLEAPERVGQQLEQFVLENIANFIESDYSMDAINNDIYPMINRIFGSTQDINNKSDIELFRGLIEVNAFRSFARYQGGEEGLKEAFFRLNNIDKIKSTLIYLLHGDEPYQERIAKCIYDDNYRLDLFGPSCIKELYGWINNDDIPICNDGVIKSMKWLGFGELH